MKYTRHLTCIGLSVVYLMTGCRQPKNNTEEQATRQNEITADRAQELAIQYVKAKGGDWPEENKIRKNNDLCNLMTDDGKGNYKNETLNGCFFVYKGTNPKEVPLLGYELVVVSLNGSKIGMGPLE